MSLSLRIDFGPMQQFVDDLIRKEPKQKPAVYRTIKRVSYRLEERVKDEMPIDTGRARAGWGRWTPWHLSPGKILLPKGRTSKRRGYITSPSRWTGFAQLSLPSDAVWEEIPDELSVIQGTRVPYVERLNEGSSSQAPAGFIDVAVAVAQLDLEAAAVATALAIADPDVTASQLDAREQI